MKTIALEVSEEFDRQIRVTAAKMDANRSEFIRQALEERLARLGGTAESAAVDVAERVQEQEVE